MRARTAQLLASLLLSAAVLATVGVCEAAAQSPPAHETQAILAVDTLVAAPSVAPAPPHVLPPCTVTLLAAQLSPLFSTPPVLGDGAPRGKSPLYLRDRALLL
ncbi:MAG TPA: hypothetical protein VGL86_04990 [Polyangia bacterium]